MEEVTIFELLESLQYQVSRIEHHALGYGEDKNIADSHLWQKAKDEYRGILDELMKRAKEYEHAQ